MKMDSKVRALIWEEFRVGGAIAGVSFLAGILTLLSFRFGSGHADAAAFASHDLDFYFLIVVMAPLLVALLLILSPGYSGILNGGYSRRILRLPVATPILVAVSLCARTLFVLLVGLASVTVATLLIETPIPFETVLVIAALYLCAQLLDWLRAPLSGLSSLIILAFPGVLGLSVFVLFSDTVGLGEPLAALFADGSWGPLAWPLLFLGSFVAAYAIAVPAVHAARVGRRVGVPEIWQWRLGISLGGTRRRRPFSSPLAAQVWHELRRSSWILPGVTLLLCVIAFGGIWLYRFLTGEEIYSIDDFLFLFIPFAALLLGAVSVGLKTIIAGFLRTRGVPGYAYLQPHTNAQFALARIISNALTLFPVLIIVVAIHFFVGGGAILLEVIPQALSQDLTSMHEIAWTLVSRGILFGIFAWALMAVSTRLVVWGIAAAPMTALVVAAVTHQTPLSVEPESVAIALSLFLIGLTAGAYAHAWRVRLLSTRMLGVWACVWLLMTWLIYGSSRNSIEALSPTFLWGLAGFAVCLALASLVPLPYVAVLLDVRRRRHSAYCSQDPSQHEQASPLFVNRRVRGFAVVATATMVIAILWLGWPARPAYEEAWRSRGYPATFSELDDWYAAVPPEENRALRYSLLAELELEKSSVLHKILTERSAKGAGNSMVSLYEDVLIVGGADVGIGEPLPEKVRVATEEHWEIVTSHVAPGLKEVSEEGPGRSRYPVELNKGHQMELAHLAKLRGLARELGVDALHWALANEPGRAADSIVAILPLGNSLSEEPILISQLVRIAIFGIAQGNLEDLMNRVSFEDEELARIQSAFAQALPPLQEGVIFNRAMVGESVLGLSAIEKFWLFVSSVELSEQRSLTLLAPLRQLAFPASTERMFMGLFFEDMRKASRLPWHEFSGLVGGDQDERFEQSVAFAPLFGILVPALPRVYEAEWRIRTQLDIAVTALAVERYRLAVGRLPVQLSDLVPVFLSAVPTDFFSSTGSPIRYRSEADGNFVVYGVGRDMEDDHGVRMKNWSREGDIIFSIVSRGDG